MGLLGLFFNRWFLKLVLLIVVAFLVLQVLGGFVSFASGLGPISLFLLSLFMALVFAALLARFERFRFLSGLAKLLCFAVLPSLLVLEALDSISVPSSLAILLKFIVPPLPYVAYFAYTKRFWVSSEPSSSHSIRRHYRRLSKNDLTPKGIESGHIVFGAGRSGFRVLKFIEIKGQRIRSATKDAAFESTHREAVKILSSQLSMAKKLCIEISYEVYFEDGGPRTILAAVNESRDYRRCRSNTDEFTKIITQQARLNQPVALFAGEVSESSNAERVLMMPTFTTLETLGRIDNDDSNARLILNSDPDRTARLRMMHLSHLPSVGRSDGVRLLDQLLRVALAHNRTCNFACIFHVKPLPDSALKKEIRRVEEAYQSAMVQVIEGVSSGVHNGKDLAKGLLVEHGNKMTGATRSLNEVKNMLRRLKDAENSGYFGVDMALIGEPATVENISRQLKMKMLSRAPDTKMHIDRLPPGALRATIRRDSAIRSDRLNGREVISLLTPSEETFGHRIAESSSNLMNALDACLVEKTASQ
jgi:hypothetical protein